MFCIFWTYLVHICFQDTQQQVCYALLDQVYHGHHPLGKTTTEVLEEVQTRYYSLPFVPGTVSTIMTCVCID